MGSDPHKQIASAEGADFREVAGRRLCTLRADHRPRRSQDDSVLAQEFPGRTGVSDMGKAAFHLSMTGALCGASGLVKGRTQSGLVPADRRPSFAASAVHAD